MISIPNSNFTGARFSAVSAQQTLSFPVATLQGSSLYCLIASKSGTHTFTVTNAAGTALTNDADSGSSATFGRALIYRLDNAASTASIKITPSASDTFIVAIIEAAMTKQSGSLDGTAITGQNVAADASTITANDLLLGVIIEQGSTDPGTPASDVFGASVTYHTIFDSATTVFGNACYGLVAGAPTDWSPAWAGRSGNYAMALSQYSPGGVPIVTNISQAVNRSNTY